MPRIVAIDEVDSDDDETPLPPGSPVMPVIHELDEVSWLENKAELVRAMVEEISDEMEKDYAADRVTREERRKVMKAAARRGRKAAPADAVVAGVEEMSVPKKHEEEEQPSGNKASAYGPPLEESGEETLLNLDHRINVDGQAVRQMLAHNLNRMRQALQQAQPHAEAEEPPAAVRMMETDATGAWMDRIIMAGLLLGSAGIAYVAFHAAKRWWHDADADVNSAPKSIDELAREFGASGLAGRVSSVDH